MLATDDDLRALDREARTILETLEEKLEESPPPPPPPPPPLSSTSSGGTSRPEERFQKKRKWSDRTDTQLFGRLSYLMDRMRNEVKDLQVHSLPSPRPDAMAAHLQKHQKHQQQQPSSSLSSSSELIKRATVRLRALEGDYSRYLTLLYSPARGGAMHRRGVRFATRGGREEEAIADGREAVASPEYIQNSFNYRDFEQYYLYQTDGELWVSEVVGSIFLYIPCHLPTLIAISSVSQAWRERAEYLPQWAHPKTKIKGGWSPKIHHSDVINAYDAFRHEREEIFEEGIRPVVNRKDLSSSATAPLRDPANQDRSHVETNISAANALRSSSRDETTREVQRRPAHHQRLNDNNICSRVEFIKNQQRAICFRWEKKMKEFEACEAKEQKVKKEIFTKNLLIFQGGVILLGWFIGAVIPWSDFLGGPAHGVVTWMPLIAYIIAVLLFKGLVELVHHHHQSRSTKRENKNNSFPSQRSRNGTVADHPDQEALLRMTRSSSMVTLFGTSLSLMLVVLFCTLQWRRIDTFAESMLTCPELSAVFLQQEKDEARSGSGSSSSPPRNLPYQTPRGKSNFVFPLCSRQDLVIAGSGRTSHPQKHLSSLFHTSKWSFNSSDEGEDYFLNFGSSEASFFFLSVALDTSSFCGQPSNQTLFDLVESLNNDSYNNSSTVGGATTFYYRTMYSPEPSFGNLPDKGTFWSASSAGKGGGAGLLPGNAGNITSSIQVCREVPPPEGYRSAASIWLWGALATTGLALFLVGLVHMRVWFALGRRSKRGKASYLAHCMEAEALEHTDSSEGQRRSRLGYPAGIREPQRHTISTTSTSTAGGSGVEKKNPQQFYPSADAAVSHDSSSTLFLSGLLDSGAGYASSGGATSVAPPLAAATLSKASVLSSSSGTEVGGGEHQPLLVGSNHFFHVNSASSGDQQNGSSSSHRKQQQRVQQMRASLADPLKTAFSISFSERSSRVIFYLISATVLISLVFICGIFSLCAITTTMEPEKISSVLIPEVSELCGPNFLGSTHLRIEVPFILVGAASWIPIVTCLTWKKKNGCCRPVSAVKF